MDTSCHYPWDGAFTRLNSNDWKYCCKVNFLPHDQNLIRTQNVQESFLKKEKHQDCNSCWKEESQEGVSFRHVSGGAAPYNRLVNFYNKEKFLTHVDIDVGAICNMSCIICNPYSSTIWQQMLNYIPIQVSTVDKFDDTWKHLSDLLIKNQNTIKHINLHGGEPSLEPVFYKFINNFLSLNLSNTISFHITSNGNYSKSYKNKFEKAIDNLQLRGHIVKIFFSLDGVGEEGTFIRNGLKLNQYADNITYMHNKGIEVTVKTSISLLNLSNHIDIVPWLENLGLDINIMLNSVNRPSYFSIANLGKEINNFLPKWPTDMSKQMARHKSNFDNFIAPQINSSIKPDTIELKLLEEKVNEYIALANLEIPAYYKSLIANLRTLS
jgi:hypothetical protein